MDGSFRKELYPDGLELSGLEIGPKRTPNFPRGVGNGDLEEEDASLWDDIDDDGEGSSDLNREWKRRSDQFHTIGFRDGVIAGQQDIAQEGFNLGFKQSVVVGHNWGVLRGITSALACLPGDLKEKLIETEESRDKLRSLHESVQSISTTDAMKLFYDGITDKKIAAEGDVVETRKAAEEDANADTGRKYKHIEDYTKELKLLIAESPAITPHLLPQ